MDVKIQKEGNGLCLPIPESVVTEFISGSSLPKFNIGSGQTHENGRLKELFLYPCFSGETALKERENRTRTIYIPGVWRRWANIQSGTSVKIESSGTMVSAGENSYARAIVVEIF